MQNTMDHTPSVAVIIPTRNGEQWLASLLSMLQQQTLVPEEILVVDSGSSDATCTIARKYGVRLEQIGPETFDHGGTRTMAAGRVDADILLYMTQDAVPSTEDALERLVRPLAEEKIGATYGRQLPAADAHPLSRHLRLFNYPDQSEVRCGQDRHRYGFKTIFISNSFAAYRRDVLAAHGFFPEHLLFGEDTLTVAKMVENGYCIAYVSEACVYHSHNYSIVQDFKRYFDIGVFHVDQAEQLMKFGGPGGAGRKYVKSEMAMLIAEKRYLLLPESCLRNCGKLLAYNLGKRYRILPRRLAQRLSMNSRWWA
jgi:rhamnosyltransferase